MKKILAMPLFVLLLISCSGTAIFYTLENEEKVRDRNNFNSSTPVDRLLLFNSGGSDYYITNGKQLWYSLAGTEQSPWDNVDLPSGYSDHATIPSIAKFGSRLYAVVSDYDSKSTTTLSFINSPDETLQEVVKYKREDVSGSNKFYFYDLKLFSIDDGLYISRVKRSWSSQSSNSSSIEGCELFYYPSGDFPTGDLDDLHRVALSGLSQTTPFVVMDMVSDGTETYLILNKAGSHIDPFKAGMLYIGTGSSFTEVTMAESYSYNRLYHSQSALFISTRSDSKKHPILYKPDSGNWISIEGPKDVQFSSFMDISSIQAHTILVGTKGDVKSGSQTYYNGDGYYELSLLDPGNPVIEGNNFSQEKNYNSTELKNATINDIFFDSNPDRNKIYISTGDTGLWMNKYSSSNEDRIWYQE